jgi:glycosyltransferase involved in cell wall biosynthesis
MTRHIAIYSDDADRGGVSQYNHGVALGLLAAGNRVTLIHSASASANTIALKERGANHRWIPYDTGKDFVRTITDTAAAAATLSDFAPDIVLFSDCCVVSNIAAKHAVISRGIPFISIVHNAAEYLAQKFAPCLPVVRGQFQHAKAVITVSTENLRLLRALFGLAADRGSVVFPSAQPLYFDTPARERREWRAELGLPADRIVSVTAARLDPMKGFAFQLAALEQLRAASAHSKLMCVFVGEGDARDELSREVHRLGLSESVHFAGRQQDVAPWLRAADLFTLTSLNEGMPISIMEAMAVGLPVVATAVGGVAEELGGTGIVLPNPHASARDVVTRLVAAWRALEQDAARRQSLGAAGRARAQAEFRSEVMLARIISHLDEALSPAPV